MKRNQKSDLEHLLHSHGKKNKRSLLSFCKVGGRNRNGNLIISVDPSQNCEYFFCSTGTPQGFKLNQKNMALTEKFSSQSISRQVDRNERFKRKIWLKKNVPLLLTLWSSDMVAMLHGASALLTMGNVDARRPFRRKGRWGREEFKLCSNCLENLECSAASVSHVGSEMILFKLARPDFVQGRHLFWYYYGHD